MLRICGELVVATLLLAACATVPDPAPITGVQPPDDISVVQPAPAARPAICGAEGIKRITDGLLTYDTLLDATDALVATKLVTKGSPTASKIKTALVGMKTALLTATSAQRVCNAAKFEDAFTEVTTGLNNIRSGIAEIKK